MIAMTVILALSSIFIAGLLVFWRKIIEWIKKASEKIKQVLGVVTKGVRTFIVQTREGLKNKSKYYNENKITKEWEETIYTKSVLESEVPPEILAKVRGREIDEEVSTTEELRLVLES